jgi:hypothetical protein
MGLSVLRTKRPDSPDLLFIDIGNTAEGLNPITNFAFPAPWKKDIHGRAVKGALKFLLINQQH